MPEQLAVSMQPGTILGYAGRTWKVTHNDTLAQRFRMRTTDAPYETKTFGYRPGQTLQVRWVPCDRRY